MVSFHRPNNMRDLLVSAMPMKPVDKKINSTPCSQRQNACKMKSWRYCPLLDHNGCITGNYSKHTFVCKGNVTCKSNNLIYFSTCKTCNQQFVGQTGGTLFDRFKAYFGVIDQLDMKDEIGRHFSTSDHHGMLICLSIFWISSMHNLTVDRHWMHDFKLSSTGKCSTNHVTFRLEHYGQGPKDNLVPQH